MDEVAGPVVAIVLVLCAVFVPVAFLSGITGQLYKQFAITIAISVVLSGIVALTLSPALAALLLSPHHGEKKGFFRWFERQFERMTAGYSRAVGFLIRRSVIGLVVLGGVTGGAYVMMKHIPTSFVPPEDQGYLLGAVIMPDAAGLDRTAAVSARAADFFIRHPAAAGTVVVDGYSLLDGQTKSNASTLFVGLKGFDERYSSENIRSQNARALALAAFAELSHIREGMALPINPPSIPGLGTTGGLELYLQSKGEATSAQIGEIVRDFTDKLKQRPEIANVTATYNPASQQLFVDVDRDRAETLGVAVQDAFTAMQANFGSVYVSQFTKLSRLFQVIVQAEPSARLSPEDLDRIYVRSREGHMVPLKALATTRYVTGPDIVTRFNNFPAVKLTVAAAPGYSTGQAIATLEEVGAEALPQDFGLAWSGQAFEERKAGGTSTLVFVFGLVMVFLILAAQYEKWSLPVGVLLAVPFAIFGALLAILLRGLTNDVYFQIGLTMLVALAAKNAILIFEFAVINRDGGMSVFDAAMTAAKERLRPIVMTSLAFILGCVPLAIALGASQNSRHSIGTGVIGGMLAATVIAVFFIPVFFYAIESFSERFGGKRPAASPAAAPGGGGVAADAPHARREDG
jgi:multidrug efflux pump